MDKFDIDKLEAWEVNLYEPKAYKVLYGGRMSMKSTSVAKAHLALSFHKKFEGKKIVAGREYLGDIKDSVHALYTRVIEGVEDYKKIFHITDTHIVNKLSKVEILFKGIRDYRTAGIKSVENIGILWLEEGSFISKYAWDIVDNTLREQGCELWITMNPQNETDFLYQEFIVKGEKKYGKDLFIKKLNWYNNPYLSEEALAKIVRMRDDDFNTYMHVFGGECLINTEKHVFKKDFFVIQDFEEPQGIFPYYGLDFGWTDASAAIRCYINNESLYITHEFKKSHISVDCLGEELEKVLKDYKKKGKYIITADSSSPDLINLLNKYEYPCKPAIKGKGSIEAGITYIKTFKKCYVHPRCEEFLKEVYNLKYKTDKHSGYIKDEIEDKENHLVDCLRYSLEDCMKNVYNNNNNFKYKNFVDHLMWI
jgi:phage terminase large subunit